MAMSEMQTGETGDEEGVELTESLVELIREHPWASLLGAAAVGYVIARIIRSDR